MATTCLTERTTLSPEVASFTLPSNMHNNAMFNLKWDAGLDGPWRRRGSRTYPLSEAKFWDYAFWKLKLVTTSKKVILLYISWLLPCYLYHIHSFSEIDFFLIMGNAPGIERPEQSNGVQQTCGLFPLCVVCHRFHFQGGFLHQFDHLSLQNKAKIRNVAISDPFEWIRSICFDNHQNETCGRPELQVVVVLFYS